MTDYTLVEEGAQAPFDDLAILRLPIATYVDDGAWREHAVCRGMGTKNFFGSISRGEARRPLIAKAIAVCQTCTVRKECFNFAKKSGENIGVWGGVDFFVSPKAKNPNVIPNSVE